VVSVGVKKIAELAIGKSPKPAGEPSTEMGVMWYGEPGIELAPLPRPQSSWLAMCPPQAGTMLSLVPMS
jgi:hypothetical protein